MEKALFDLSPDANDAQALEALRTDPLRAMAADWATALGPVEPVLKALGAFLAAEADAGRGCLPRPANVLRAFERPLAEVKVLITGQDPYPTPGHSIGLAFAVDSTVRPLPRSLSNIYKEMHTDLGLRPAVTGNLRPWADQGVLLLNRVLTVSPGITGSHRRKGWEEVTEAAVRAVARRDRPLVAILWGNSARELLPVLGDTPAICSAHPSPLSAARGFFGSRPFSRANALLAQQGATPVDWSLDGG